MYPYLWLTIAFALNASASLCVKYSNTLVHLGLLNGWIPTAYARILMYAIACLGVSFVCFTIAARALPISLVYSVHVGMSLFLLTFISWYFMGETLTELQYLGIALLLFAVILITVPDMHTQEDAVTDTIETVSP